jgi:hypothetical protein
MSQAFRDPALGLACDETPFYPPKGSTSKNIPSCDSCRLVFSAPVVGSKTISVRSGKDGLSVDESALTELEFNTSKYNLYDTVLWKEGAHRDFKKKTVYDLEMNLYLRDAFNPSKLAAIAIPITINDKTPNLYFEEMMKQDPSLRSHSLEKLIGPGQVLIYKGMDLRGRNADKPYAASQCQSATASVLWFILPPVYMSQKTASWIQKMAETSNLLPPKPSKQLSMQRAVAVTTIAPKIVLKSSLNVASGSDVDADNGIYLTRALQCQRIDPKKDISGNAVYLNGVNENTLEQEINETAADSNGNLREKPSVVRPKQIQSYLSTIVGIILGIACFAAFVYFFMNYFFKGMLHDLTGYIKEIVEKKTDDCSKYVTPYVLTGPAPPPKVEVPGLQPVQAHLDHTQDITNKLSADITKKFVASN